MALFVDLDDEDAEPPQVQAGKSVWPGPVAAHHSDLMANARLSLQSLPVQVACTGNGSTADRPTVVRLRNDEAVAEAMGCYPIIMTIVSSLDLNTLDNLSRTCRQIRQGLLQYRKMLLRSTLRCCNEHLPVDGEETLRYRARAGDWYYMEDTGRTSYNTKSGLCARDLVSECRRCGTAVCRNCAIKPPAPIVLRERHRRLCLRCTKVHLGRLISPPLPSDMSIKLDAVQRAICICDSDGVWLCQPCGRGIRSSDNEYRSIWKWRNQYGEVLGGVGTGIGEGDRGVICGRDRECLGARGREQETDCDAADARDAEFGLPLFSSILPPRPPSSILQSTTPPVPTWILAGSFGNLHSISGNDSQRTPSPAAALGPGYARHEIEGIGGVVKTKLVRMVRVGACVPEWPDERARGEVLGREVKSQVRSWCGWCWRAIPGRKDYESDSERAGLLGKVGQGH